MRWTPNIDRGVEWIAWLQDIFAAAILGAVSGLSCVAVRKFYQLLQWIITGHAGILSFAAASLPPWRRILTPALGGIAAMAVLWIARRAARPAAFKEYVEAVRLENGRIPFSATFWRTLSAAFSVASGAAIGREGSMIQFAAALISKVGQWWKATRLSLADQVSCGVAAAVGAVYQAPIGGVFFAAEIASGKIVLRMLLPLLAAAFAGTTISHLILGGGPLFPPHDFMHPDLGHLWLVLPLVLALGVAGPAYTWLLRSLRIARKLPLALLWSGVAVGVLSLYHTEVWGNGDAGLFRVLQSGPGIRVTLVILLARLVATTFCVGTGAIGGVFTPTVFAGSALGLFAGYLMHASHPVFFAVLGMGCMLAATTHAPLMSAFMAVELTGQWLLLPLMLACSLIASRIAQLISPHSLYALATPEPAEGIPRKRTFDSKLGLSDG
jgi:chloride channel protein, CIC family